MPHHHHDHAHGSGCCHHEHHEEDKETYQVAHKDSLYSCIDTTKMRCFNEEHRDSGKSVIKPDDEKLDTSKFVQSAVGADLLFVIPFSVTCHVEKIELLGGDEDSCPTKMKIWKNRDDMDFDMVEDIKPDQDFDIGYSHQILEFNVRRSRFRGCQNLVLYFPDCPNGDKSKIFYIGIRGKATKDKRQVVEAIYESAPQIEDHKVEDEARQQEYSIGAPTEGEL
uniref:PITH domain-containing protein n=1 Tax=Percolomonas cosmopolitus TaxID=63605 RepID=A0A7S1KU94_9EUKA|mmetsp:Transcript_9859/g.36764  ORF Transcript_9859/g.36764 Transcript_9859/m.36764 type:complete len:223 (+) Transcript_9859:147-815(+)|eukprot:CAMPEP_0117447824 /NCGR_PEP_ID=MMETSP0759-20121206/7077_1 /TAXON_ID=63605 /ORGANISM="Percolomonas cosmopolitus, Strain WS" /LENGTH=222 /DNA_ID=CAMNT_0005240177 /DNA_START=147 /DNA_END=815 /DNA_ORIENTATION=+